MIIAPNTMTGERRNSRSTMLTPVCTWLTSFVRRVIRLAEEKRSMSANENSCTWSNIALRRFAPKPWLPREVNFALPTPAAILHSARSSMRPPVCRMTRIPPVPRMPSSMIVVISRGRPISQRTSTITSSGPRITADS